MVKIIEFIITPIQNITLSKIEADIQGKDGYEILEVNEAENYIRVKQTQGE